MHLQPLTVGAAVADEPVADSLHPVPSLAGAPCQFCGWRSDAWQFAAHTASGATSGAACALCHLAQQLGRPCVDEEAVLVWLPEMSQAALNTLFREVHLARRASGHSLVHGEPPMAKHARTGPDALQASMHHAVNAIAARAGGAEWRLGTQRPSDLARALASLSPATRPHLPALLSGLRVMPLGRFRHNGKDAYPAIVDAWRRLPVTPAKEA